MFCKKWAIFFAFIFVLSSFVQYKLKPHIYKSNISVFNTSRAVETATYLSKKIGNRIVGSPQEEKTYKWLINKFLCW